MYQQGFLPEYSDNDSEEYFDTGECCCSLICMLSARFVVSTRSALPVSPHGDNPTKDWSTCMLEGVSWTFGPVSGAKPFGADAIISDH